MIRSTLFLLAALFLTAGLNRGDLTSGSKHDGANNSLPTLIQPRTTLLQPMPDVSFQESAQPFTLETTSSAASHDLPDGSSSHVPTRPLWIFGLIGCMALLARVYRLNHAREMADHERDFHHAKSRMFQMLQGGHGHTNNALRPTR